MSFFRFLNIFFTTIFADVLHVRQESNKNESLTYGRYLEHMS